MLTVISEKRRSARPSLLSIATHRRSFCSDWTALSRLVMEFSAVTEMYHLHHTESVRNCHADLGGQFQSGSGDMAVIRLLSQHPDPTAGFPGQHRCGIHIEKHLSIPVAHLFHVLFPHHGHATFTHGVKDDFNLSKPREHPQKAHN